MTDKYKAVFHLEKNDVEGLTIAVKNIRNLIKDKGAPSVRTVIVANYVAPKLFVRGAENTEIFSDIAEFVKNEILSVYICNNSLNNLNMTAAALLNFCEVVPAGITKIIELQMAGFAYIKP